MNQARNLPRLIFAGTPDFAAVALRELVTMGYPIPLVLTTPDRKAGRGLKISPSPVKILAEKYKIPIFQPMRLDTDNVEQTLRETEAETMVVAAYGKIVPAKILKIFNKGCLNIHASLLPRWRGAAPIQRAILAGDKETGISIMHMEKGLDTGPVYLMEREKIYASDTSGTLERRLRHLGARAIVQVLDSIAGVPIKPLSQDKEGITYAHKISKLETKIDWKLSAFDIDKLIRALSPNIGAITHLNGRLLKIWKAKEKEGRECGVPGTVTVEKNGSVFVQCGINFLLLEELQIQGKRRMEIGNFIKGAGNINGTIMGD